VKGGQWIWGWGLRESGIACKGGVRDGIGSDARGREGMCGECWRCSGWGIGESDMVGLMEGENKKKRKG